MLNPPKSSISKHSTIGDSFTVDQKANQLFRNWLLPLKWIPRTESPDIFMDYNVEIVANGEPTGEFFRVQLKGRKLSARNLNHPSAVFKTKHLLYYLKCKAPVFLFLIDPKTEKGFWLFAQGFLRGQEHEKQLNTQNTYKISFDARQNMESTELFEKKLSEAIGYMKDLFPGTPLAAIKAEQQYFEQIDPRYSVCISVKGGITHYEFHPKDPNYKPLIKLVPSNNIQQIKNFFEKGDALNIKSTDIDCSEAPILKSILNKQSDHNFVLEFAEKYDGAVQIYSESQPECVVQINGEWRIALRKAHFKGKLPNTPLKLETTIEVDENGTISHDVSFNLDYSKWSGQQLIFLSHFEDLFQIFCDPKIKMRYQKQGITIYKGTAIQNDAYGNDLMQRTLKWLNTCRKIAIHYKCNPILPPMNVLSDIQSDELFLLRDLIETGKCEREGIKGRLIFTGKAEQEHNFQPSSKRETLCIQNQGQNINFFGINISTGPLQHTFTDLELIEAKPTDDNQVEAVFETGPRSTLLVEYSTKSPV